MKRALLFFPPQHCLEEAMRLWTFAHASNFPLALLRLATHLRTQGYQLEYLDAFNIYPNNEASYSELFSPRHIVRHAPCGADGQQPHTKPVYHVGRAYDELQAELKKQPAVDDIYVSSIFTWSWRTTHESIALLKRCFPRARIHLGGVYPTLCPEKARTSAADVIHTGTQAALENCWLDSTLLRRIPHLDGLVVKTSVGCPNACTYCAVHLLEGRRFMHREPLDVVDEIAHHYRLRPFPRLYFWESNLLLKFSQHLHPILEGLRHHALPLQLMAPEGLQPNLITSEIARALYRHGFKEIRLTLETTAAARLTESGRPTALADIHRAVAHLIRAGFSKRDLSAVLLLGQPSQTLQEVLRDIIAVYKLGIQTTFLVYSPIPGTKDFETYSARIGQRALEDLDSFLFPMAHPGLTVPQCETILRYFNNRHFSLARIAKSRTDDPLIAALQQLLSDTGQTHAEG